MNKTLLLLVCCAFAAPASAQLRPPTGGHNHRKLPSWANCLIDDQNAEKAYRAASAAYDKDFKACNTRTGMPQDVAAQMQACRSSNAESKAQLDAKNKWIEAAKAAQAFADNDLRNHGASSSAPADEKRQAAEHAAQAKDMVKAATSAEPNLK